MFTVYILKSGKTGKRYVGQTSDLAKRLKDHNSGQSRYTKSGCPWTLLHYETYNTRSEAMKREKFLKSGRGREIFKNLPK